MNRDGLGVVMVVGVRFRPDPQKDRRIEAEIIVVFIYIYIISNNKPIKDQDLNVFTCCWCNSTFFFKINVKMIQFQHQLFRVKTITSFFFFFFLLPT